MSDALGIGPDALHAALLIPSAIDSAGRLKLPAEFLGPLRSIDSPNQ